MTTDTTARLNRLKLPVAGALLLALGGAAGAVIASHTQPPRVMAPTAPVAIKAMADDNAYTIRGRVDQVYGDRFVIADASGRTLVETGPNDSGSPLVTQGEPVIVQGRFDDGAMHAAFLIGPDHKVIALGPLHGPHGPGRDGPGRDGPGRDRPAPPAPPAPGAPGAAAQGAPVQAAPAAPAPAPAAERP